MIYSIGEMLIDFMQEGNTFIPYPGGAPANVAIHARKAGSDSKFIGKLSNDSMGKFLKSNLIDNDVYLDLEHSDKATALALVSHVDGERSFQFYRTDTADLHLSIEDIENVKFNEKDILHLCSLGLVPHESTYEAHLYAISKCRDNNGIVSFDVNLRERLWDNLKFAKNRVLSTIVVSDIIKVNEEELEWLSGTTEIESGLLQMQTNNQVIICTVGAKGSVALLPDGSFIRQAALKAEQIDSTGAGDSYIAMILHSLNTSELPYSEWVKNELHNAMAYASTISARVVGKHGATPDIDY